MRGITILAVIGGGFYRVQASSATAPLMAGTAYFVSPTGSDNNVGTMDAPFKTISKAISKAQSGDQIYVRAGIYPAFDIAKSGIAISGYNGEMPVISGGLGIRCYQASGVTIAGFEVTASTAGNYAAAIFLDTCSDSLVASNKVHHNLTPTLSGIAVHNGSRNRILNNEVYNNAWSGIIISGVSSQNEIAFNVVHDHTLTAGDSDGIGLNDDTVTATNMHDNLVYGNSDDGFDTWASPGNVLVNNISYGNGGTGDGNGFKLGGGATGGNNTVIGNKAYSNQACGFTSNGNGNYYQDNLSYGNSSCGFDDSWRNPGNTQTSSFINNTAYNNPAGNFLKSPYTTVFIGNVETPFTPTAAPSATATASQATMPTFSSPTATIAPSSTSAVFIPSVTATVMPATSFTPAPIISPTATITASDLTPTSTLAATQSPMPPTNTPTASAAPVTDTPNAPPATATAVAAPPSAAPQEVIYDDTNNGFTYSSGWQDAAAEQAYGGSYKTTAHNGSRATFVFSGSSFSIFYVRGPKFRNVNVYVDGVLVGTINQKASEFQYQQRWDFFNKLESGTHTLQLVTKNKAGTFISLDAVMVK